MPFQEKEPKFLCFFSNSLPDCRRQRRQEVRAREPDGRGHPEGRLGLEPVPEGTDLPEDRSPTSMVLNLLTRFDCYSSKKA
jgi:hypothetical protein